MSLGRKALRPGKGGPEKQSFWLDASSQMQEENES
jgi:hypothetical protein